MALGLFDIKSKFELVDVDSVFLTENNILEIPETTGFSSIIINVLRELEDRGGSNFEFGDEESFVGFDHHNGAFYAIDEIIKVNGSDSNIMLVFSLLIQEEYVKIYEGNIIPSSMEEEDDQVYFRVKRIYFGELLRTRFDVENDIESNVDLSGNKIQNFDLFNLPLHSKVYELEGIKNNKDSEILIEDSFFNNNLDLGSLWGIAGFNQSTKDLKDFSDYGNIYMQYEEGVINNGLQGLHVNQNPIVRNKLHLYKTEVNARVRIRINHTISFVLDTEGISLSGQTGNFDEITALNIYIWRVNNGVFVDRTELFTTGSLNTSVFQDNVFVEYDDELQLNGGDEIYYGFQWFFGVGGFNRAQAFNFLFRSIEVLSGFAIINTNQRFPVSNAKGGFIYDVLNRLIQKAISGNGVGEIRIHYINLTGNFQVGQIVIGKESRAKGKIFALDGVLSLIEVQGAFKGNELVYTNSGSAEIDFMIYGKIGSGMILKSNLLESEEQNGEDGCAALNFITNGFAIRNFINEDYENERFYSKGEKVRFNNLDYKYINEIVAKGNEPTDIIFWKQEDGRKIRSSIKKIIDFIKFRYGAGISLIREPGIGFETDTNEKITRVLIEKNNFFFQNKKIMSLDNIENPVIRKFNKNVIFNEIELGFNVYAEENENNSINGFNTIRNYLTPIEKDKNKLSLITDVGTDSFEIERLRRLSFIDTSDESDEKDDDTFIIKCQRHNDVNPIKGSDRNIPGFIGNVNRVVNEFVYGGLYLGDFADKISTITHVGVGTFNIKKVIFNEDENSTTISTVEPIGGVGVQIINDYEVYFDIDVFLPERLTGFLNVSNGGDIYSEYNIDHTPTNFLINNFSWFGSGLIKKEDRETIKFTSGKNNYFFEKQYLNQECVNNSDIIRENQNFELERLREYDPEIFGDYIYNLFCYMDFITFKRFKEAMVGESMEDINYGFLEFQDNNGVLKEGFPMDIKYNPVNLRVELEIWEKR